MKKNYIIIFLSIIVVLQLIFLFIFFPQANNNIAQELDEETVEDVTSLLAKNISIELSSNTRSMTSISLYGKITNSNDVAIEFLRGTILFYNNQNQLVHTESFQDNTLIPKNFTRTKAFYITIPREFENYSNFEIVFQEIIPV